MEAKVENITNFNGLNHVTSYTKFVIYVAAMACAHQQVNVFVTSITCRVTEILGNTAHILHTIYDVKDLEMSYIPISKKQRNG